jgi:hypothetical protein
VDAVLRLLTTGGWLADAPDEPAESNGTSGAKAAGSAMRHGPAVRRL